MLALIGFHPGSAPRGVAVAEPVPCTMAATQPASRAPPVLSARRCAQLGGRAVDIHAF